MHGTGKTLAYFFRFCIVGGISTIIDLVLLVVFVEVFSIPLFIAATIAFLAGVTNGYFMNKYFTFGNTQSEQTSQMVRYYLMAFVALLITLLLMGLFVTVLHLHYLIARVMTVFIVLAWTFNVSRLVIFQNTEGNS